MHWPSAAYSLPVVNLLSLALSDYPHCTAKSCLSRTEAAQILDAHILPTAQKGARLRLGGYQAGVAVAGNDPALFETYGEFPLSSLDILLDRAEELLATATTKTTDNKSRKTVVDLGAGCGRLALYMALSRTSWDVHGIEIASVFHQEAVNAVERAVAQGCLLHCSHPSGDDAPSVIDSDDDSQSTANSRLSLHLGAAGEFPKLLQSADLIFCYSTAFESSGFSEQATAMILGREWNELLTSTCQSSSLCITTEKALDPVFGWRILDRIDVPNPEVFESTGYIQRLERKL